MKRSRTHIFVAVVLIFASLASYIFLNYAGAAMAEKEAVEQYENNKYPAGEPKMFLPDVEMVKKVLETGRRLLPAS